MQRKANDKYAELKIYVSMVYFLMFSFDLLIFLWFTLLCFSMCTLTLFNLAFTWIEKVTKGKKNINNAALARQYFKRSPSWLAQRVNGNTVFDKKAGFRPAEYNQLAEAFRDIARRLNAHADEIDAADPDPVD